MWFHASGEATIDASNDAPDLLVSSQRGRFWSHRGEVLVAELLPPDEPGSMVGAYVVEACRWLRHNGAERSVQEPSPKPKLSSRGWSPEAEVAEPGVARLVVFADADERLVRILFEDGGRMEFRATASEVRRGLQPPREGDEFRLLDAEGAMLRRTFGAPLGAERHVAVVRALLRRLSACPEEDHSAALLAEAAQRQGRLLLLRQGAARHVDQAEDITAGQALQRCHEVRMAIESVLAR